MKIKHLKFECAKSNAIHKISNQTKLLKDDKTLPPTIVWHRISCESENCTLLEDFRNKENEYHF